MDRREAISRLALIMGGTFISTDSIFATAARVVEDYDESAPAVGLFTKKQVKLLDEVADTILPRTATPGAKDAKVVGQFIARFISDCYEPRDQKIALEGILKFDTEAKKRYGKSFAKCNAKQRHDFLAELDAEQRAYTKAKKAEDPPHWFRIFWELSLFGFFTSEVGSTQVLRWVMVPGRYETIDYKKGDRAWGG